MNEEVIEKMRKAVNKKHLFTAEQVGALLEERERLLRIMRENGLTLVA